MTSVMFPQLFQSLSKNYLNESDACQDFNKALEAIQQAYWTYVDNIYSQHTFLPKLSWYEFAYLSVKTNYPNTLGLHFNTYFKQFDFYQKEKPVCGIVCLDKTGQFVLLVKGVTWSFPKGKKHDNESEADCAIRECFEETGLKLTVNPNQVIHMVRPKPITLFIVQGVDMYQPLKCCKYEITRSKWVPIYKLPYYRLMGGKAVYSVLTS